MPTKPEGLRAVRHSEQCSAQKVARIPAYMRKENLRKILPPAEPAPTHIHTCTCTHEAHAHIARIKLITRIMWGRWCILGMGFISLERLACSMEEAQNPNNFTAKTMHCETNEIGFMVAVMPSEVDDEHKFTEWLMSQTVEVGLIPMVFEVKLGDKVIIAGGSAE